MAYLVDEFWNESLTFLRLNSWTWKNETADNEFFFLKEEEIYEGDRNLSNIPSSAVTDCLISKNRTAHIG